MLYNYIITSIITLIIDGLWLFISGKHYLEMYQKMFKTSITLIDWNATILAYLLLALGTTYFIVNPALNEHQKPEVYIPKAGLLGLIVYGVYNMTNKATLKGWQWGMSLVDTIWGIVGTILISSISIILLS